MFSTIYNPAIKKLLFKHSRYYKTLSRRSKLLMAELQAYIQYEIDMEILNSIGYKGRDKASNYINLINQRLMTAVEWLVEQLARKHNEFQALTFYYDHKDEIEQAKAMEQEQMKNMYLKGIENYDPTFKRKSQWTEVDNITRRLK